MVPRVSVVVRSYGRVRALCELLEILLAQDHPSFEIVVVEQSSGVAHDDATRLATLARDPRVRVIDRPPLGGARARNVGVEHARGELLVFIDDDDLPDSLDFLTAIERPFVEDPRCLGVTCRHLWGDPVPTSTYRFFAQRRCMRFSKLLRFPYTYARHDRPVRGVDYVHGTGGALRRTVLARHGGWDEDTPVEDESSLGIRISRGLAPGEYLAFDPRARLRRRMDLDGGLDKRGLTTGRYYRKLMTFVHRVLGRYHPVRTRLLYPLHVIAALWWTVAWIWLESKRHSTRGRRVGATAALALAAPWHVVAMLLWVRFGRRPGSGEVHVVRVNPLPGT